MKSLLIFLISLFQTNCNATHQLSPLVEVSDTPSSIFWKATKKESSQTIFLLGSFHYALKKHADHFADQTKHHVKDCNQYFVEAIPYAPIFDTDLLKHFTEKLEVLETKKELTPLLKKYSEEIGKTTEEAYKLLYEKASSDSREEKYKNHQETKRLIDMWASGNLKSWPNYLKDNDSLVLRFLELLAVESRNLLWMKKLTKVKNAFVVVGIMHVILKDSGLLDLLSKDGWSLESVPLETIKEESSCHLTSYFDIRTMRKKNKELENQISKYFQRL